MGAVIGALKVVLGLDRAEYTKGLSAAQKELAAVSKQMQAVGASMQKVGATLTAAITVPLLAMGATAVKEATEMRDALGQVNAALKSMGDGAKRNIGQLTDQANELAATSLFEDDQILRGVTANLLTFGKVAGSAFDRAQQAAVDLATRMGTDLQSATLMIGKALNAPTQGLAALRRVGIQFTEQQQAQIKAMDKVGNTAGAQAIMLSELERQFGGSAQAARDAAPPMERVRLAFANMAGNLGTLLLPIVDKAAKIFEDLTARFSALSPETQKWIVIAGGIAAALGPVIVVLGTVVSAIGALIASPLLPFIAGAAVAAAGLGVAFARWHKDIIPAVVAFGKQIAEVMGPKLKPLFDAAMGAARALGAVFVQLFSGGGDSSAALKNFGTLVSRVVGALADILTGAFNVASNVLRAFAALLRGDIGGALNALGSAVGAALGGIGRAFETLFPEAVKWVRQMVDGVSRWLTGRLFDVIRDVVGKVKTVSDAFFRLYDAVVGHSYVPDLVIETGQWFSRLQKVMVDPATEATKKTGDRFQELRDRVRGIIQGLLTDQERAALDIQSTQADLARMLRVPGVDRGFIEEMQRRANAGYRSQVAGWQAGPLDPDREITDADSSTPRGLQRLYDGIDRMKAAIADSRDRFADAFSGGLEMALSGDWKDLLRSILSDVFESVFRSAGKSIFDALSGQLGNSASGGINWSSMFSWLPKFANGGSILAGGSGGIDKQLVQFWKSPSEQVDIYKPGADRGGGTGGLHFDLRGAVMTSDLLQQMQAMAGQAGSLAYSAAQNEIPRQMMRRSRQRFV